jgi:hypothetical protein
MHKALGFGVLLLLLDSSFAPPMSGAETSLETRLLLGGIVEMLVPTAFQPMPEEMLKLKYPMERRPALVLSNDAGSVSLALNHTRDRLPSKELAEAHRAFDRMFRNMYPSAHWFRSELAALNGRQFIVLELRTPAIDTEVRNLIIATSVDERLLLVTVNMTKQLEGAWLDVANRMIRSIVLKK